MAENFKVRFTEFLDAAYPLLGIDTFEETRVIVDIRDVVKKHEAPDGKGGKIKRDYYEWDEASQLQLVKLRVKGDQDGKVEAELVPGNQQPTAAIGKIVAEKKPAVLVMKDIHPHLDKSMLWRTIRNHVELIKERGICIIFLCARLKIPPELSKEVQILDYAMPSREALENQFGRYVDTNIPSASAKNLPEGFITSVAEAAMGMTYAEADNAFSLASITSHRLHNRTVVFDSEFVKSIFEVKISNLKNTALEYMPTFAGFESVGGLEGVKAWANRRREGFNDRARVLHLPYPKGVLLAGIKGCIAGDTIMDVWRNRHYQPIALREFYKRSQKQGGYRLSTLRRRDADATGDDTMMLHDVVTVIPQGEREVIKIMFEFGKFLECTPDHLIAIKAANYWKPAEQLVPGDEVIGFSRRKGRPITAHQMERVTAVLRENRVTDVYDITMADPYHNFVANGIVVHNCVDGDAEIQVNRAGKGFRLRMRDLYLRFNGKDHHPKNRWTKKIKTMARSLCDEEIRLHEIDEVLAKGEQRVLKLTLDSGKMLRLTPDHEVYCPGVDNAKPSLVMAGALQSGMFVYTNGYSTYLRPDGYVAVNGMYGHPRANSKGIVLEHILVAEKKLGRPIRLDERVDHDNEIKHDNRPGNLKVMSESDHGKKHRRFRNMDGGVHPTKGHEIIFRPRVEKVVSVVPDGVTDVYDIVMKDPHRNFTVNGVIVSNCGKTTTAMAIAHQFQFPLFKFDVTKLYAGKVGESEALTRDVIRLLESLGRCCVLVDEMEKFFSTDATSGGGDSGVSSRMFGTLVSWMSLKTCPVFMIGTLNNFDRLPPELTRKGRFDEVFFVDLPTEAERIAIFSALIKHKFKASSFENCLIPELVEKTRDFSGAEIEAVIEEALYGLLGTPQAKGEDLLMAAADSIKPQAQLEPELVTRLRNKAAGFKQASMVEEVKPVALLARGKRKVNLN